MILREKMRWKNIDVIITTTFFLSIAGLIVLIIIL